MRRTSWASGAPIIASPFAFDTLPTKLCQALSTVFSRSPSPPQKRVQERVAALARERQSGNTLLINLGWGACCQAERLLRGPVNYAGTRFMAQKYGSISAHFAR